METTAFLSKLNNASHAGAARPRFGAAPRQVVSCNLLAHLDIHLAFSRHHGIGWEFVHVCMWRRAAVACRGSSAAVQMCLQEFTSRRPTFLTLFARIVFQYDPFLLRSRNALRNLVGVLDRLWSAIGDSLFGGAGGSSSASTQAARQRAQSNALVVWLLGKTGAGKTAIVAALTGDPRAEVGQGFEPCTRTASFYDVPAEAPLLRFLDTRGLGEASYDPSSDISWCEEQSHLLLVVMQLSDPSSACGAAGPGTGAP